MNLNIEDIIEEVMSKLEEKYVTKTELEDVKKALKKELSEMQGNQDALIRQFSEIKELTLANQRDMGGVIVVTNDVLQSTALLHKEIKELKDGLSLKSWFSSLPILLQFTVWVSVILILQMIITIYAPSTINDFIKHNGMAVLIFNTLTAAFFTTRKKKGGE